MFPPSRRAFINTLAVLPIVAAMPAIAPAMTSHPSDERLVAAAEGVFASEAAIDRLYQEHHAAGAFANSIRSALAAMVKL
jgi:hypothetical protein